MLVLDENVPAGQRLLLRKWRVRFRVIGVDVAAPGTTDENLIPVLQKLSRPTFFSLDRAAGEVRVLVRRQQEIIQKSFTVGSDLTAAVQQAKAFIHEQTTR